MTAGLAGSGSPLDSGTLAIIIGAAVGCFLLILALLVGRGLYRRRKAAAASGGSIEERTPLGSRRGGGAARGGRATKAEMYASVITAQSAVHEGSHRRLPLSSWGLDGADQKPDLETAPVGSQGMCQPSGSCQASPRGSQLTSRTSLATPRGSTAPQRKYEHTTLRGSTALSSTARDGTHRQYKSEQLTPRGSIAALPRATASRASLGTPRGSLAPAVATPRGSMARDGSVKALQEGSRRSLNVAPQIREAGIARRDGAEADAPELGRVATARI